MENKSKDSSEAEKTYGIGNGPQSLKEIIAGN